MDSLILEISTPGMHRYEPIEAEITTLGRALDNDIILSDPTVAPHHLKIVRHQDGRLELINLAAVNPTRVEALPIDTRELATLTGSGDPVSARSLPVPVTVVTLGADGARIIRSDTDASIAAMDVSPVDTTGAGDTFCGALAAGLDAGLSLESSVQRAVVAGSLAVTAIGARTGMPTLPELEGALQVQASQAVL